MTSGARKRQGGDSFGFSLIEMLICLVIMSLALSVLYQSAAGATRNVRVASDYARAVALAESTLEAFSTRGQLDSIDTGEFDIYEWRAEMSPVKFEVPPDEIPQDEQQTEYPFAMVTVTVFWQGNQGERQYRLQTVVLPAEVGDEV